MAFDPDGAAAEDSGIYGLPYSIDESRFVIVPVPFDATTSYRDGTRNGPEAIYEASRQVDLFDVDVLDGFSDVRVDGLLRTAGRSQE